MRYLGIDPGNEQSGYVIVDEDLKPIEFGKVYNEELLRKLYKIKQDIDFIAIEMIGHYGTGMPAGKTVFDTCVWIGRYEEALKDCQVGRIMRSEEKMNLCGTMKAKDSNIRQALIDRFAQFDFKNGKGTKVTVRSHVQTGSYEKQDGTKVYTTDFIVDEIEFPSKKESEGQAKPQGNFEPEEDVFTPVDDEDIDGIPF